VVAEDRPSAEKEDEHPAAVEQDQRPSEAEQAAPEAAPASESATVNMFRPAVEAASDEPVAAAEDTPAEPPRQPSPGAGQSPSTKNPVSWPTESARPDLGAAEEPAQAGPVEDARPQQQDAPPAEQPRLAWPSAEPPKQQDNKPPSDGGATAVFRPVTKPTRPDRQETGNHLGTASRPASGSEGATSVFRPAEPPRTERPSQQGPRPDQNEPTNLFRPPGQRPTQNPSIDSPTVNYLRPVQPPRPPENPPSFVRPRQAPPTENRPTENRAPERQSDWPPPEPPRAAPQRVGPQAEEPPTRRKSKKPLLVTAIAIVAVIGIAAGVVFGVPGLAQKLGLAGEDTVAVAPPPGPISYSPGLHGPAGDAPTPTKQGVAQALAGPMGNPALGTVTGIVIDPATGEALYERDAGTAITPASTGKLLTAATALLSLDHSYQLVTKVVAGDQPGDVIIVGGGDPTISSLKPGDDDSIYKGGAHLDDLVDQVKASGVQVNTVYIDQSRYAAPHMAPSWLPEDVGAGYIAPIVPAMLDGDRRDASENYSPRSTDPGRTLVDEFARRVGASPAGSIEKKASANAKVLGEIRSAPVSQLVDNMLDHSENTLGDILAHEVAVKAGQEPNFDGAAKAMLDILRQNKFDVDGVVLKDGSGMSTENKVSAKLLAQLLAVAAGPDGKDERTAKLRPLLGGLPVAGGSGTLEDRYNNGAATEGRGWVRAKTGTLTGVNSLAGIVMDKDNRPLVFAFLTADTEGATARPALDTVAAALRGCGCQ
jgi:D-alanyl-D-alanine carboxypeptidase/D-alanyl-D-alanine-endopeptidase (penicillin-binding protein 4)